MTQRWRARAHIVGALGMALAAAAGTPQALALAQGPPPVDAVSAQVRRYFDAVTRNDAAALEGLLAPDYVEVSPLGQMDRRAQVLGFYRLAANAQTGQASELAGVTIDELSVRVYGDVAVAIVGESFTMNVGGKPVARPMRSTLVWHKAGNAWKLVSSHHATVRPPIAGDSSAAR